MKNNVYVRSNRSIMAISLTRLIILIPLIIYGFYKNGIYLYHNHLINAIAMFKPLIIILGGALIAVIINLIYEYFIKKHKNSNILDMIFSSFHVEYAVLLGCIMSINVNLCIYFSVLTIVLIISKFIDNKINTVCLCFLIIYGLSKTLGHFDFLNVYEASKTFSYGFLDYLIGRTSGGIASTHIILLLIALLGISITNNNKTTISLTTIITYLGITLIYAILFHNNYANIIFGNNYFFLVSFIATDSVTSCYTNKGMIISGFLIAAISFGLYFVDSIIAPILAILLISILAPFIENKIYLISNKKSVRQILNI